MTRVVSTMGLFHEKAARHRRYALALLRHARWSKVINLLRVEYRRARNNPNLRGLYPWSLVVDISNVCNLRCPLCTMGQRRLIPRENLMSLENYVSLVEPLRDYLFLVFLYNWAEPFFNRDIYKIIRWNTQARLATFVSSNLNVTIDAEELVRSGLQQLVISGDGITQDVYEKYRVGGNLAQVLENLKNLVAAKRRLKSRLPYIEWQCLVTRYNEGQLDEIKRTILGLGADEVRFANLNLFSADDRAAARRDWLPQNPAYRAFAAESPRRESERTVRRPCYWLWRTAVINANGGAMPCCLFDVPDWGNALTEPFGTLWNNERFDAARKRSSPSGGPPQQQLVCDHCDAPFLYR